MSKKEIRETHFKEAHIDEIIIETEDNDKYVFLDLPWYDDPLFCHRFSPTENKRTFTNRLPYCVKEHMHQEHSGYSVMKTEEKSYGEILF